jgi:two-component system phosphate regulon sensor histidine kinase PhoR
MTESVRKWLAKRWLQIAAALAGFAILASTGTSVPVAAIVVLLLLLPALMPQAKKTEPQTMPVNSTADAVEKQPLHDVKSAFEGFESPTILLDSHANILYQNRAAIQAFGEMEVGDHISARVRLPAVLDLIRDTIASGRPGKTEITLLLPTETIYQIRMSKAGDGAAVFYVLNFRDVSESLRIDRMRSDFIANASHELRTPLASLRGFIETLLGPARNDQAAHQKFLGIMLEQVTRMSRLVDDLLSLSRLELKARVPPDELVDLVPLIGSVRDALSPLAGELGIEMDLDLPAGPVLVTGDRDELTQVFENLIENACKYGQDGKKVEIGLRPAPAGQVEISIRDHGPGIPSDHVPRLTERFYRVNVESSRSKKGTGLGLAIVKHILTRHHGRLAVRSEIGKGSTFSVFLDTKAVAKPAHRKIA